MKIKNFFIIIFLSLILPSFARADLKPAYFFAEGKGRAWAAEKRAGNRPDIGIDEEGQAWVIFNGRLYRAQPESLQEIMIPETMGMLPLRFTKSSQGKLYVLWMGRNEYGLKVTSFSRGKIKELVYLRKGIKDRDSLFFYVDSAGCIWITGEFPVIFAWKKGEWKEYGLKQDMFVLNEWQRKKWPEFNGWPIKIAEVSPGKMIFWAPDLDGLLIFSEGNLEHFRQVFSLPRFQFKEIKIAADGVLWVVGIGRRGWRKQFFEVDVEKKKVNLLIPSSHPLGNQNILQILPREQGEGLVLCKTGNEGKVSLWRISKDRISCEVENLGQTSVSYAGNKSTFLLVSKKGHLWLPARHLGVWLKLKTADTWKHLDCSFGFPLHEVGKAKEDKEGNIWFCGYRPNGVLACLESPDRAVEKWLKSTRPQNWRMVGGLHSESIFDNDGHLWKILSKEPLVLGRFNQSGWRRYSLKGTGYQDNNLFKDDKGSVWLINLYGASTESVIFENGKAVYFSNLESACESIAKKGEVRNVYEEQHRFYGDVRRSICSIKNGKACFLLGSPILLHYFDGNDWKHWQIQEIDAFSKRREFDRASNQPFFDEEGNLYVNIRERTWSWDGQEWRAVAYREGPEEKTRRLNASRREQQETLQKKLNRSNELQNKITRIVEANDGTVWAQSHFSLYKVVGDLWVEIDKGRHPLMGDRIDFVYIDKEGNLFVKGELNGFFRLAEKHLPPETLIETRPKIVERFPFSVSFSGKDDKTLEEKLKFSCSLDEKEWSVPSQDRVVSFDWLDNGKHTFRVKALDEELNYDPTPASFCFMVKIDFKKMLAEALEMLESGNHEEREKAVKYLVCIGKEVLPQLKKVRTTTSSDDLRWWIDVAIQQINLGK